jgi:hypothetical protein
MPDPKVVLGAVVVIIFTALAATYSRPALWFALGVSLTVYILINWRDWFGDSRWPIASTVLIGIAVGLTVAGLWWFGYAQSSSPPPPKRETERSNKEDRDTVSPMLITWKNDAVQFIRVRNMTAEKIRGINVVVDRVDWWMHKHGWVECDDGRAGFFPKKLTGGSTEIGAGQHEDFVFISDPVNAPDRAQFHELDGSGLEQFQFKQHDHRLAMIRLESNGREPCFRRLAFQIDKSGARPSTDPPVTQSTSRTEGPSPLQGA